MKGLIYKDIVILKKQLSILTIFLIVYGGFCASRVFDLSILFALVVIWGVTIPMSSISMDDASHWDRYAAATPVGRQGVVAGKYLFTLLVVLLSTAVGCALTLCLVMVGLTEESPIALLQVILTCGAVTLLLDAVLLPFLLKYGAEKTRLINVIIFTVAFGGAILLGGAMGHTVFVSRLSDWLIAVLPAGFLLLSAGGFILSYSIAQTIYARKEF